MDAYNTACTNNAGKQCYVSTTVTVGGVAKTVNNILFLCIANSCSSDGAPILVPCSYPNPLFFALSPVAILLSSLLLLSSAPAVRPASAYIARTSSSLLTRSLLLVFPAQTSRRPRSRPWTPSTPA